MIGVLGFRVRVTGFPVEGVSETPVTVTLKERIEVPASGVSVMVRLNVELPPPPPLPTDFGRPLQEASERIADKSRGKKILFGNMGTPRRVKLRALFLLSAPNPPRNFTAPRSSDSL